MRPAALAKTVARHGALAVGTLRGAARGFVKDGGPRVLSYHGVCADPPDEWSVTPGQLRAQMDVLRREFQPVSLQAIVDWLRGGPPLPPRAVAVTFDDGFRDVLTIGDQRRPDIYSLTAEKPAPVVPRARTVEVRERLDAFGNVVTPLADGEPGFSLGTTLTCLWIDLECAQAIEQPIHRLCCGVSPTPQFEVLGIRPT